MRGSPLIRTLIILVALVVAGFGLSVLGSKAPPTVPKLDPEIASESDSIDTPFVLTLSAPAKKIALESLGQTFTLDADSQTITGTLPIELGHPTLFIDIEWVDTDSSPRFAKLVLEPAGYPTKIKIFDATGDLSDVWELHLHHDEHE